MPHIKEAPAMLLPPEDARLFFKLQFALLAFVNQRLRIVPEPGSPGEADNLTPHAAVKLRDALLAAPELIGDFVAENPADLADEELEIVHAWRHQVGGDFYIYRYLAKHTVFLHVDGEPVAYGVVGLTQPLDELVWQLPVLTKTVLLPFRGRIIYDGLLNNYNISFGPGIRRSLADDYRQAKRRLGIVTTLPPTAPSTPTRPSSQAKSRAT
jgi:hypothetical protein